MVIETIQDHLRNQDWWRLGDKYSIYSLTEKWFKSRYYSIDIEWTESSVIIEHVWHTHNPQLYEEFEDPYNTNLPPYPTTITVLEYSDPCFIDQLDVFLTQQVCRPEHDENGDYLPPNMR